MIYFAVTDYGMTETTMLVTIVPVKGSKRHPGSVGIPMHNVEIKVGVYVQSVVKRLAL